VVVRIDTNNIDLYSYSPITKSFSIPKQDINGVYIGGGKMAVLDNFRVVSKKFNFLDDGQCIQLGFIDILMNKTQTGAISLNVYIDYNNNSPVNILDENQDPVTDLPDTFFNSVVPTTTTGGINGTKYWQRIFCPTRGAFITIEWTLSNEQMQNDCQSSDVQIDAQILWIRKAGRQLIQGV
jgi:hypothetical protein